MKIAILGAGVIGVSTAFELSKLGYEVSVFDRQSGVGLETSFKNAGLISPGHTFAWANPQVPLILLKSLVRNDQAFRFKFSFNRDLLKWGVKFLKECTSRKAFQNTLLKYKFCEYSQNILNEIIYETGIQFHRSREGLLFLHRSQKSFENACSKIQKLGSSFRNQLFLSSKEIIEKEPTFSHLEHNFTGAIFSEEDESGDCFAFTKALVIFLQKNGHQKKSYSPSVI